MATEKPRFSITVEHDMMNKIEDYRHEHLLSTRSKAVVELIQIGLDSMEKKLEHQRNETCDTP